MKDLLPYVNVTELGHKLGYTRTSRHLAFFYIAYTDRYKTLTKEQHVILLDFLRKAEEKRAEVMYSACTR